MQITPKPAELLQAQVAAFAESRLADGTAETIFRQLGHGALTAPEQGNEAANASEYQNYVQFLRSRNEGERNRGAGEAETLSRYSEFEAPIQQLRSTVEAGKASMVGHGQRSEVYRLEQDDKAYAVRLVNPKFRSPQQVIHDHVAAGVLGRDIPGLERIVAASYEQGVVVSEFVEGKHMKNLSKEEILSIPHKHLDRLVETRLAGTKRGIKFDQTVDNTFYDPDKGFTDIDYGVGGQPIDKISAILQVFQSLSLAGEEILAPDDQKPEMNEKKVAVYQRFVEYLKNTLSAVELTDIQHSLQMLVAHDVTDARTRLAISARRSGQAS